MSVESYIAELDLSPPGIARTRVIRRDASGETPPAPTLPPDLKAAVDVGSLLSFVDGIGPDEKLDVLYSVQLAQRGADGQFDRFKNTENWYKKYADILGTVGWVGEQFAFVKHDQIEGEFRVDKAALKIIMKIATQDQLGILTEAISALEGLADDDDAITLLKFHGSADDTGNFQIGAVQKGGDTLSMALGAYYFRAVENGGQVLFFKWGGKKGAFYTAASKMTLNRDVYAKVREPIRRKLGDVALDFIADLKLG